MPSAKNTSWALLHPDPTLRVPLLFRADISPPLLHLPALPPNEQPPAERKGNLRDSMLKTPNSHHRDNSEGQQPGQALPAPGSAPKSSEDPPFSSFVSSSISCLTNHSEYSSRGCICLGEVGLFVWCTQ